MVTVMAAEAESDELLRRAAAGDQESWGALLTRHEERLRRMVAFRLDQRLQGRIDPADVIQEALLEAWQYLAEYFRPTGTAYLLERPEPRANSGQLFPNGRDFECPETPGRKKRNRL